MFEAVCTDIEHSSETYWTDYNCACDEAQYTGKNCQIGLHPRCITLDPCQNSGNCVDSSDNLSYTCECTTFWTGTDCEIPKTCAHDPCIVSQTSIGIFFYSFLFFIFK